MVDVHFRIYDTSIIEKLEYISAKHKVSKTAICKDICQRGISEEYRRMENIQNDNVQVDSVSVSVVEVLKEFNADMKNMNINKEIQNSLLSVMYKLLISIMANEKVDIKAVEMGLYDSLPKRFSDKLDKLILIEDT